MHIEHLWLQDFKGVAASLPSRSINVFFGKNDSGKSNILEAISSTLGRHGKWRRDPLRDSPHDQGPLLCEAAIKVEDAVLERLLLTREVKGQVRFPSPDFSEDVIALDVGPLSDLLDGLEARLLAAARLRFPASWAEISDDYRRLLRRRLSSRWLISGMEEIWWVAPPREECDEKDVQAATRVLEALWPGKSGAFELPVLGHDFVGRLPGGGALSIEDPASPHGRLDEWWMFELDADEFPLFEVVRITADPMSLERVADRLETDVRALIEGAAGADQGDDLVLDAWLELNDQGWARVSPRVEDLCGTIGSTATTVAPRFVAEKYDIAVTPVPPWEWAANQGKRLRLEVKPKGQKDGFDLRVVGSGVGVWAAYALEEAMRRVQRENRRPGEPSIPLIMLIDEPERHLHPTAQREVAAWLATQLAEGVTTFLVTHAMPFLSLPAEDVAYHRVWREGDVTRTHDISTETKRTLARLSDEAGIRPVDLLSLIRAVLIVEGRHDERVINEYYGRRLSRAGIEILPIEGHREVRQLVDLRFIGQLDVPMIALLDDVSWAFVRDPSLKPSTDEEKSIRVLRELSADIQFTGFEEPDIWCAIPDEVVRKMLELREGHDVAERFSGWSALAKDCRTAGKSVKKLFCAQVGIAPGQGQKEYELHDQLLRAMLATRTEWFPDSLPAPSLRRAVENILARSASQPPDIQTDEVGEH